MIIRRELEGEGYKSKRRAIAARDDGRAKVVASNLSVEAEEAKRTQGCGFVVLGRTGKSSSRSASQVSWCEAGRGSKRGTSRQNYHRVGRLVGGGALRQACRAAGQVTRCARMMGTGTMEPRLRLIGEARQDKNRMRRGMGMGNWQKVQVGQHGD